MERTFHMSYFLPPIAPIRDGQGRFLKEATLTPACTATLEQVHRLITADPRLCALTEQVRAAADLRAVKSTQLPYVTPCGTFSRRAARYLLAASGLVVVDVDHLDSPEQAAEMRCRLFDDPWLQPALTFVSPGGRGVKAFVPYPAPPAGTDPASYAVEQMLLAMQYVEAAYAPSPGAARRVDTSGKDLARACFLSHDEGARRRE